MISNVFWTEGREFAFQRVGDCWRVYKSDGEFDIEFRSFWAMCLYIQNRMKKKEADGNEV